jgi:hypothetical protein
MKKLLNYSLLVLLLTFVFFACSKMDSVTPDGDSNAGISQSSKARSLAEDTEGTSIEFDGAKGKGFYTLSDVTKDLTVVNGWKFTIKASGDLEGLGLSNLVIGLNYCPNLSYVNVLATSGKICEGVDTECKTVANKDIDNSGTGGGTNCNVDGVTNRVFKLDNLQDLKEDVVYTVYFTLNQSVEIDNFIIWVKAGNNCKSAVVNGTDCDEPRENCSYSLGRFFAAPHNWCNGSVTVGGILYTEGQGREIFKTPNNNGILDYKAGFLQLSTIYLSRDCYGLRISDLPLEARNWITTIETALTGVNLNDGIPPNSRDTRALKNAAGSLGDWIDANHCERNERVVYQ